MATKEQWDNKGQYSKKRIKLYEQIFGEGYISPGGHKTTVQMCVLLKNLKKNARVLDIGSGIGGAAFFWNLNTVVLLPVWTCVGIFARSQKREKPLQEAP